MESQNLFYRVSFEVAVIDKPTFEAFTYIIKGLSGWLKTKEGLWRGWNLDGSSDIVDMLDASGERFVAGGSWPVSYDGGRTLGEAPVSKLRVDCLAGDDLQTGHDEEAGGITRYWAMDYDEPDVPYNVWAPDFSLDAVDYSVPLGDLSHRRWHTSVGVTEREDGSCLLNVRVSNYMEPGYVGNPVAQPINTTPLFVRELIADEGLWVMAGGAKLLSQPCRVVSAEDEFFRVLESQDRALPVISVVSDAQGEYPCDIRDLVKRVTGVANVYVFDWADGGEGLIGDFTARLGDNNRIRQAFEPGTVYIHAGEAELLGEGHFAPWRRYGGPMSAEAAGRFSSNVVQGLINLGVRPKGGVVDTEGIEIQRELFEAAKCRNAEAAGNIAKIAELKAARKELEYAWESAVREEEKAKRELKDMYEVVERMGVVPDDSRFNELQTLLRSIRGLYPDKVALAAETLSEARDAADWDFEGVRETLMTVPTVLWDAYFGGDVGNDKRGYYNENAPAHCDMTTSDTFDRMYTYNGERVNCKAHLRNNCIRVGHGGNGGRRGRHETGGTPFRVYFYPDQVNNLIVIGHAGKHLPSFERA